MYQLINFDMGSQTVIAEFDECPTPEQIEPLLAEYDKSDKANFLIANRSLTLDIGRWLAIYETGNQHAAQSN